MEVLLLRQHSIERRLRALFTEGDTNGDGVLSFEEFNDIIARLNYISNPEEIAVRCQEHRRLMY